MRKNIGVGILGFVISFAAACNNGNNIVVVDKTASDSVALMDSLNRTSVSKPTVDTALNGCYSSIMNRDTTMLQLQVKGANITGTLVYDFYEKDRNDGTIQAEMVNGILMGWYLFKSEGVLSVRQVGWKPENHSLIPATGEMIQRNDTLLFKNVEKLSFDSKSRFVKIPCIL